VALAAHLLDPSRSHPVAVVSIPSGRDEPWIDAGAIAEATRDIAEVVVLPTDASSWRLSELLPPMTQVYGGAGRVYPVDERWLRDQYRSPLRFAYGPADTERATDALISDALRMGQAAGRVTRRHDATPASGVVKMLVEPSRAVVVLDGGGMATIWQELTAPDVRLPRLLTTGMRVAGLLEPETRRLDVTGELRPGPDAVADYAPGDVVLTMVTGVQPDVVHLALHPDVVVPVTLAQVTGNPLDRLTDLFSEGETVVARIDRHDGHGPTLRLDDLDEQDEPRLAPALLPGGPPWLTTPVYPDPDDPDHRPDHMSGWPEAPAASTPAEVHPTPPRPTPGATLSLSLTLDASRADVHRLESELAAAHARLGPAEGERDAAQRQVAWLTAERQRLLTQVEAQRTQLRRKIQSAGKVREVAPRDDTPAVAFTDPECQLRHEVYLEWAERISAAEKDARPLAPWSVGPDFLASLDQTEGVARGTVVRVIVEVLTGLAETMPGREVHRLRTGSGGDDAPMRREDGALCWRASIQRNTPSARRLHYWQGGVRGAEHLELSRVVLHDDMRP